MNHLTVTVADSDDSTDSENDHSVNHDGAHMTVQVDVST